MERTLEPEVMDTAEEADGYDAMDHSEPNAAFVERLCELEASGRMLDIGTGPGHIPVLICERVPDARVVGIDLSKSMLALAELIFSVSAIAKGVTAKSATKMIRCLIKRITISLL